MHLKKIAASIAALGAVTFAHAANVEFYGSIDNSVSYIKAKGQNGQASMYASNDSSPKLGLTGKEDIGNGHFVRFKLENGYSADTGELAVNGSIFNRESSLTVGGSWGEVTFGRLGTFFTGIGTYGQIGKMSINPCGTNWHDAAMSGAFTTTGQVSNAIVYQGDINPNLTFLALYSNGAEKNDWADEDHLYQDELLNRQEEFAHGIDGEPLFIYGTYPAYAKVVAAIDKGTGYADHNVMEDRVVPVRVKAFEPFEAEGYRITPLEAQHDVRCEPVIYLIEKDGKALLYAHDTGLFPESTWEYLAGHPVKLNLVSLDATHAIHANYSGHMGFAADAQIRDRLVKEGLADESTIYVANHFTHNAGVTYDEMLPVAEQYGFLVSYDGMEVEF